MAAYQESAEESPAGNRGVLGPRTLSPLARPVGSMRVLGGTPADGGWCGVLSGAAVTGLRQPALMSAPSRQSSRCRPAAAVWSRDDGLL